MGSQIKVNPEKLNEAAGKIDTSAIEYKNLYEKLFAEVEAMASAWQGADNVAYTNQIKGFADDFKVMKELMDQYSTFLKSAAKAYQSTQTEVTTQAARLTN